jgi:hypothetical protein
MQQKSPASSLLPTLGLLALAGGLGVIFSLIGRWRNLPYSVPEFIALSLTAGALYVAGVYLVERFVLGPSALLVIVLGALFFRLCLCHANPRSPAMFTVTSGKAASSASTSTLTSSTRPCLL